MLLALGPLSEGNRDSVKPNPNPTSHCVWVRRGVNGAGESLALAARVSSSGGLVR